MNENMKESAFLLKIYSICLVAILFPLMIASCTYKFAFEHKTGIVVVSMFILPFFSLQASNIHSDLHCIVSFILSLIFGLGGIGYEIYFIIVLSGVSSQRDLWITVAVLIGLSIFFIVTVGFYALLLYKNIHSGRSSLQK